MIFFWVIFNSWAEGRGEDEDDLHLYPGFSGCFFRINQSGTVDNKTEKKYPGQDVESTRNGQSGRTGRRRKEKEYFFWFPENAYRYRENFR